MRVFISVDMEGIGGIVKGSQVISSGRDYSRFRKWMTEEVKAVIEGIKSVVDAEITVADSHGSMSNILIEDLPEGVEVITGFPRPVCMVHGVWNDFNAIFFVGYHAKKGQKGGVLAHTVAGRTFFSIHINGVEMSEFHLNALVAGEYNVPVALIAGDQEICNEAKRIVPNIETVITKSGITRFSAITKTLESIKKELKSSARTAIQKVMNNEIKPLKLNSDSVDLVLKFFDPDVPDVLEYIKGFERVDGRTIKYVARNIIEAYKMIEVAMILSIGINAMLERF